MKNAEICILYFIDWEILLILATECSELLSGTFSSRSEISEIDGTEWISSSEAVHTARHTVFHRSSKSIDWIKVCKAAMLMQLGYVIKRSHSVNPTLGSPSTTGNILYKRPPLPFASINVHCFSEIHSSYYHSSTDYVPPASPGHRAQSVQADPSSHPSRKETRAAPSLAS